MLRSPRRSAEGHHLRRQRLWPDDRLQALPRDRRRSGSLLFADIAHIAGLIAAWRASDSIGHAHITTSTAHKTLRGPRSGFILSDAELGTGVDKTVFPGMQGGPLMHVIAGKAVAFGEALQPDSRITRADQSQCSAMARRSSTVGFRSSPAAPTIICSWWMLAPGDQRSQGRADLDTVGISTNRNTIPGETRSAYPDQRASHRHSSHHHPRLRRRGLRPVAEFITRVLRAPEDEAVLEASRARSRN